MQLCVLWYFLSISRNHKIAPIISLLHCSIIAIQIIVLTLEDVSAHPILVALYTYASKYSCKKFSRKANFNLTTPINSYITDFCCCWHEIIFQEIACVKG